MDKPHCAGAAPIPVDLEPGKKYAWCSCGLSASQPFCDGNHKREGCGFRPHVFTADGAERVWFCTCKLTGSPPWCDGTHKSLANRPD